VNSTHGKRPRKRGLGAYVNPRLTTGFKALVVLLALLAIYVDLRSAGAWGRGREPLMVVARQTKGRVMFDVYERSGWLWSTRRPRAITVLSVADWVDGTAVWEIEAAKPRRVPVTYAQVPKGFSQTIPAAGGPPALRSGGFYGVTVHDGRAIGVATFNVRAQGG
jgi:hypothetical protein